MSLDWNVSKIKDSDTVCWDEKKLMRPLTQVLIFATMAVDLGAITEKNAETFYNRLRAWETCVAHMFNRPLDWKGEPYVTLDEVKSHIGLTTNVYNTFDSAFRKKLINAIAQQFHV